MKTINDIIKKLEEIRDSQGDIPVMTLLYDSDDGFIVGELSDYDFTHILDTSEQYTAWDGGYYEVWKQVRENNYQGRFLVLDV